MDKELYRIAADACQLVYGKHAKIGTTEFNVSHALINDEFVQVLAIAGTNEIKDWWRNINLFSKDGIKIGAWKAAHDIKKYFVRNLNYKLLVCGHSKAGPTSIAFKRLFGADYCIAFAPARSLRYWADRKMDNTTLFIDPDDPVSKVGFISFGHPVCEIIKAENDHFLPSISDHMMGNWIDFVDNMV